MKKKMKKKKIGREMKQDPKDQEVMAVVGMEVAVIGEAEDVVTLKI